MNGAMLGHLAGRHGKHRVHGWIVSAVVHVGGVGAAFSLMTNLPLAPQPETFRWEVSLQEPTAPIAQEQPEPTPAPPVPKKVEPKRAERTPVAQRPTESVEQVVREAEPIEHQAQAQTRAAEQERESLHETGDPIVRQVQASPMAESRVQDAGTVHEVVPTAHAAPLVQHVPIRERVLRALPQTQADYGWLRESILARIQQLKHYPSRAKMNDWEGKVIVRAVIREDGSIVDLMVAESSGHEALDQEALLVVKTASPLTLKHPLGKTQMPILVPIIYRLDG